MRCWIAGWIVAGGIVLSSGCSSFSELSIRQMDSNAAYKAWKVAKWDYYRQGVPYALREHIGRGFRQGFQDVAGGGTGETPIFPPGYYWGPEYRNQKGSEAIAAWFRGYQDGVLAADQAGIRDYVPLPTSWAPANVTGQNGYNQNGYGPGGYPGQGMPNGYGPSGMPGEAIPPGLSPMPAPSPPLPSLVPENDPLKPRTISPPPPVVPRGDKTSEIPPGKTGEIILPDVPKVPSDPVPTTTAPAPAAVDPKAKTPAATPEVPAAPAGKQTFAPPGSPRRSAHADVVVRPVSQIQSATR